MVCLFRIDPLELDALLVEATVMNTRVDLYLRFIRKKLMSDFDALDQTHREKESVFLFLMQVTKC